MKRLALLFAAVSLTACATTQHGPMQRIAVDSEPLGAVVELKECGVLATTDNVKTPAIVWVSRRATQCTIEFSKLGYKPVHAKLSRHVAGEFLENVDAGLNTIEVGPSLDDFFFTSVLGAVITGTGMAVDGASGAMFEQRPYELHVVLCPTDEVCSPSPHESDDPPAERQSADLTPH